jgi:hypothetical protein
MKHELIKDGKIDFEFLDDECEYIDNMVELYWPNTTDKSINTAMGNIVSMIYELGHDGFDSEGPESYLHDITITFESGYQNHWHREYWFSGEDDELYQLY